MDEEEIDKIIKKIDKVDESRLITRESIVGFLVAKHKRDGESFFVDITPLSYGWDGLDFCEDNSLTSEKDEIVAVIPAQPDSFKVSGIFPDKGGGEYPDTGFFELLGHEFKGAYSPDWKEELKNRIKIRYTDR